MIAAFLRRITRLDAHHRLSIGLFAAGVAWFAAPSGTALSVRFILIWIAYALTILVLTWIAILTAHPRSLRQLSRIDDSSRTLILVFVVVAAVASLFAVIALLDSMSNQGRAGRVTLAILTVVSAWALVHTVFTLHYAHLYYGDGRKQTKQPGGLNFSDDTEPDYLDFAYFAFVIGMTSQVSDVTISSKPMRRTALLHGVLSFGFNTIIIALTISGLSAVH